ncbi:hypothetical protein YC2023_068027 [Brassica napus]
MDAEVWRETMAPSTVLEAPLAPPSIDEVRWLRPPPNWLKCNVASSWTFNAPLSGAAWLLRDEEGKVLLHSRRAFTRLASPLTTELHALLWSVESMVSHHSQRVIFETSSLDLRMALLRPDLFPQFHVTSDNRSQSYVASGGPLWLNDLLIKEASATALRATAVVPAAG